MPHNSCTVVLNGHGVYSTNYIINFNNINYNLTFLCGLKESISNAHHNLFLNNLCKLGNIQALESLPTTYLTNRAAPSNLLVQDMNVKHNILSYDHCLTNAQDVQNSQSFNSIDNQRFASYDLWYDNKIRDWNGTLNIQYDHAQVKNDIIQTHKVQNYKYNPTINLSRDNLIYITPKTQQGNRINFKLSDLIQDILPKIKIPVSYHPNDTVDIIPLIFLDDNLTNKKQLLAQQYSNIFNNNQDTYHELTIAGDANIIWDACRDLV